MPPWKSMFSPDGQVAVEGEFLGHVADDRLDGLRLGGRCRSRRRCPRPRSGWRMPQSMRMVVDLPAPLGPRKPKISPLATLERDMVDRGERPERLGQVLDVDARLAHPATLRPRPRRGRRGGRRSPFLILIEGQEHVLERRADLLETRIRRSSRGLSRAREGSESGLPGRGRCGSGIAEGMDALEPGDTLKRRAARGRSARPARRSPRSCRRRGRGRIVGQDAAFEHESDLPAARGLVHVGRGHEDRHALPR